MRLSDNALTGSIPRELGQLASLRVLFLNGNHLTGSIPRELGQLDSLWSLALSGNALTGSIPRELGQLDSLRNLGLSGNALTGSIPRELGQLDSLGYLSLSDNALTGSIPRELGQLARLRILYLYANHLEGSIPPELGQLDSLGQMDVSGNDLTGLIPPELGQLAKLRRLLFSRNAGLCMPGIPVFRHWFHEDGTSRCPIGPFCHQADMNVLESVYESMGGSSWIDRDGWLGRPILGDWHGVTADSMGRVQKLDLSGNGLVGEVSPRLAELAGAVELRLNDNDNLAGRLSLALTELRLKVFHYDNTKVCEPSDEAFRVWLNGIDDHEGTGVACGSPGDREILAKLYRATGGANWKDNTGWLSARALNDWHGVTASATDHVTQLRLSTNALKGHLPPELGQLDSLQSLSLSGNDLRGLIPREIGQLASLRGLFLNGNHLTGLIPREIGQLASLWSLGLSGNALTGSIPRELGQLDSLQSLSLSGNDLRGLIPRELGQLASLRSLYLDYNDLTGSIPRELGQLARLHRLYLNYNDLTGSIPRELGQLASLRSLYLNYNDLTGSIPREIGQLDSLHRLYLDGNELTGSIPREIGQLDSLGYLSLSGSDLTGTIPHELGRLADLWYLELDNNDLTGQLPSGLGKLNGLRRLDVRNNDLTGSIPLELGKLASLEELYVERNAGMTGALPSAMTALTKLRILWAANTGLCAMSDDEAVRKWLDGIPRKRIDSCDPGAVYLTQAVQTRHQHETVPLVAAEKALLRVFLVAAKKTDEHIPDVRATFYVGGRRVKEIDVPGKATAIPTEVDEGDLSKSANAEVPGATVQPGLEVVVEVDSVDASLGVPRRIPATGRLKIPVDSVPVFKLTLIPFLYDADPDSSIIDTVDDMAEDPEDHNLFRDTRTLLPVESLDVTAHAPVEIDSDRGLAVLRATDALRVAEGGSGYYKGMMPSFSDVGGVAYVGGWSSASRTNNGTIAHELGHSMSLRHAPCGGAGGVDPLFPDKDGRIGSWGYDFAAKRVVSPRTPDLMSYCGPPDGISGYHLDKAFDHRVNDEGGKTGPPPPRAPARSLLLWGGTGADGQPYLEPVFVMDAPPALPVGGGDHRLRGLDAVGGELFSLPFDMPEIADGDGSSAFAFALPADPGWAEALASITLSGPGGSVTLDGDGDRPTAIVRDPRTGEIRAILRDPARARALAATLDADVLFSRGIPDADAWRR